MHKFTASLQIIGINPFVFVPDLVLNELFHQSGKHKGSIPIRGTINALPYRQTLVKYSGCWRLYINTSMLKNSPKRIGETIELTVEFDPSDRTIQPHPKLVKALAEHESARIIFDGLTPSLRLEVVRYIDQLKTEAAIDRNIIKAINFLLGKGRFAGRDRP